jgi:hypothetical protein
MRLGREPKTRWGAIGPHVPVDFDNPVHRPCGKLAQFHAGGKLFSVTVACQWARRGVLAVAVHARLCLGNLDTGRGGHKVAAHGLTMKSQATITVPASRLADSSRRHNQVLKRLAFP